MLTETLSGKCPCCNYDKMLQRYGSIGYYQMDGCPKCGFGYGTNHQDDGTFGVEAWIDYAKHILASFESDKYIKDFEDDVQIERTEHGYKTNGGKTKEEKAYEKTSQLLESYPQSKIREMIFTWSQNQKRHDDLDTTVFTYTEKDVKDYLSTNPMVF